MLEIVFKGLLPLSFFLLDLQPKLPIALFDLLTNFVDARLESQLFVFPLAFEILLVRGQLHHAVFVIDELVRQRVHFSNDIINIPNALDLVFYLNKVIADN